MIILAEISPEQRAMMDLTNHAQSKRGLMCGSFDTTEARKVTGYKGKQLEQMLSYMEAEQLVRKHGRLYWINQG